MLKFDIMSHNPKDQKLRLSNEFFYLVNGVKEDAALHEEMLAEGDARISAAKKNKELSDKLMVASLNPDSKQIPLEGVFPELLPDKKP